MSTPHQAPPPAFTRIKRRFRIVLQAFNERTDSFTCRLDYDHDTVARDYETHSTQQQVPAMLVLLLIDGGEAQDLPSLVGREFTFEDSEPC